MSAPQPRAAQGVDLDLALRCVELAKLAYAAPDDARRLALEHYGYEAFASLSRREARDYLMMVTDAARVYVAVRGTDERRDWFTNLKAWYCDSPLGRVHKGYYDVSAAFLPELEALVGAQPGKQLVFTGHSMGGAVAVLLGALLEAGAGRLGAIYTFGQPQVGGADFTRAFQARCPAPYFRFVHGADAVAVWTRGSHALLGTTCYFDLRGRLSFGGQLSHVPRLGMRFHRLDHYRYFLKLNRLRMLAIADTDDETVIQTGHGS